MALPLDAITEEAAREKSFRHGQTDISVFNVWQDYCTYYQMPRIQNEAVFRQTVIDGVSKGDYSHKFIAVQYFIKKIRRSSRQPRIFQKRMVCHELCESG